MKWPGASRDAEAFADALEGRGHRDSDVQHLVRFAESLCEAAVDPSPDFVLSLRSQLMADAPSVLVAAPRTTRTTAARPVAHPVRKRLAAATAAVLVSAGMVGIVSSSAQALPGEMLYPVKRGVEAVELAFHRSDAGRGEFQLSQAGDRLSEAQSLIDKGDSHTDDLVAESLTDFTKQAEAGSKSLFSDYAKEGDDASIDKVNSFATQSSTTLAALSGQLSPGADAAFKAAASTVRDLAMQASSLCTACRTAELTSLADAVSAIIKADESTKAGAADLESPSLGTPTPPAPGTINVPPPRLPVDPPPPAPTPGDVGEVPEPIGGALLGDDDQIGLVPGLLGGSAEK